MRTALTEDEARKLSNDLAAIARAGAADPRLVRLLLELLEKLNGQTIDEQ